MCHFSNFEVHMSFFVYLLYCHTKIHGKILRVFIINLSQNCLQLSLNVIVPHDYFLGTFHDLYLLLLLFREFNLIENIGND